MDIKEELKKIQDKINPELKIFFDEIIKDSKKNNFITTEALKQVKKITLAGGKRLRPALMYWAYAGVGGKNKKEMIKTSISIELIHVFLLIHDDIIDNDAKRHGVQTVHAKYDKIGKIISLGKRDSRHFGNSIGIVTGDILGALGNRVLFNSKFAPELVVKALSQLQNIVARVAIGEAQDVFIEHKRSATEAEVMDMYKNKTAKYTFEGPLHLGAILGGADKKLLNSITKFSVPVGVAFQIQDDILGIFGDEEKIGKPVGSDIREGKQTILVVRALKNANKKQKEILTRLVGKKDITKAEVEEFRNVIRETKSLDYANALAKKLIEKGKAEIKDIGFTEEIKTILLALADYMAKRDI
ncbi:MAG: polyprenyl synthetase family protein [Parcubacteria group bacterium]|jgi:geranylgeranyl diphosphate synthase type I